MGEKSTVRLGEIVTLRKRVFSGGNGVLASQYPIFAESILHGAPLGGEDKEDSAFLKAAASFAADALDELIPLCELAMQDCQKRLRREGWLKLAAYLVSIFGTSSVLASLSVKKQDIAIITAWLTLAATLAVAIADFVGTAPGGRKVSVQATYEALSSATLRARIASKELRLMCEFYGPDINLAEKVKAANVLAGELNHNTSLMMIVAGKKEHLTTSPDE